jgi:hypothetical protein
MARCHPAGGALAALPTARRHLVVPYLRLIAAAAATASSTAKYPT